MLFLIIFGMVLGVFKLTESNFAYLLTHERVLDHTKAHTFYYKKNNSDATLLVSPEINKQLINESTVEVFIPIFESEVTTLKKVCNIEDDLFRNTKKDLKPLRNQLLECYQKNHDVYLDGRKIRLKFLKTDHPITGQFGIQGFMDIDNLKKGKHSITIEKKHQSKKWEIPFYYSPSKS